MTLLQSHKKVELEVLGYVPTLEPKQKYKIGCCNEKIDREWLIMVQPSTNHYIVVTLNGNVKDIEFI